MSDALTPAEVARLRRLLVEDDIKQVKLLYSQLMDAGRIDELAQIFTEDAVCRFGNFGDWHGRQAIRDGFAAVEENHHGGISFYAMHATTNHWVEVTGPDTAIGRSYLIDVVTSTPSDGEPIVVLGVYDEAYRLVEGAWQIEECVLQFLWPNRQVSATFDNPFGGPETSA